MIENSTSDIVAILQYLNQSGGGIPIKLTSTVATSPGQFWLTFILSVVGSFFLLSIMWNSVAKPAFSAMAAKMQLQALKVRTKRNMLIIKHSSSGMFDMSMITQKTMVEITKALHKFGGKPFDLVLHTPGGEIFSSLFISRLLREYPGKIRVIVPYFAMSGGTLLALSGHEIYMSPTACLGPVDPQLGNLFKYGSARSWDKIMKLKGKRADDSSISFAFTGQQYTKSISNYINELLVGKMNPKDRVNFVKFLTTGDIEHAYPLTITQLNNFGLKAMPLDEEITKKLNKLISSSFYEGVYHI